MNSRITPDELKKEDIGSKDVFVFGSNESGIHGSGAARFANRELGARWGIGFGASGYCFAIPTKDWEINTLSLNVIYFYVTRFIDFAKLHNSFKFYVTQIGCGLAGLTPEQIAPMFKDAILLENIYLPQSFWGVFHNNLPEKYKHVSDNK